MNMILKRSNNKKNKLDTFKLKSVNQQSAKAIIKGEHTCQSYI